MRGDYDNSRPLIQKKKRGDLSARRALLLPPK
jgi:hypothetical protein